VLDWLAYDFMAHDYDAKHVLRQVLLSKVYQAPVTRAKTDKGKDTPLLGPVERRLTAEQFLDGVAQATGYWPKPEVMNVSLVNPKVRAWRHKKPDPLATVLGRPNREQVCTERNQESTVLQALELVNGSAMSQRLREGARALLASDLGKEEDAGKVAQALYQRTLGRPPSDEEAALVKPLLGSAKDKPGLRQEGWEDVLWVLFLSPEFQFVR
jgi:Protein of unknown function (DUF1553)